jgi:hypothetical protein
MNREDVELLLRSTRPVPAPDFRAPRLRSPAGAPRLQIGLAAAFLLCVVAVIAMPPGAANRSEPGGRRWLLPVEISSVADDLRGAVKGCQDLVRTPSGGAAFVTDWRVWVSRDGKAPWKKYDVEGWHPSEALIEGDRISFLTISPLEYLTVDVARGGIVSLVRLPQVPLGKEWSAYLAGEAANRYAVLTGLGGPMFFLRSADGGRHWSAPREIARTGENQMIHHNPTFVSGPRGLWLFYVGENRRINGRRSTDQGETWAPVEGPLVRSEFGPPVILRAAAVGETLHLVCLTEQNAVLHFSAADGGSAWSPASPVLQERIDGLIPQSKTILRSAGGRLLLSGIHGVTPRVSDDGGMTWKAVDAFDGLRGTVEMTPACVGADGTLSIAPLVVLNKRRYLLFRESATPPQSVPLDEAGLRSAESSIALLSDDDIQVRDRAVRELTALGLPVVPTLRLALARTKDPERKARLSDVIRRIELGWPDAQAPDWWQGAAER